MERVAEAPLNGAIGRSKGLRDHLTAEYALTPRILFRRKPPKQVNFKTLDLEQIQEF